MACVFGHEYWPETAVSEREDLFSFVEYGNNDVESAQVFEVLRSTVLYEGWCLLCRKECVVYDLHEASFELDPVIAWPSRMTCSRVALVCRHPPLPCPALSPPPPLSHPLTLSPSRSILMSSVSPFVSAWLSAVPPPPLCSLLILRRPARDALFLRKQPRAC